MPLKNCEDCQNPVSPTAYECPRCGMPQRLRPRLNVGDIVLGVMLGYLAALIVLSIFDRIIHL